MTQPIQLADQIWFTLDGRGKVLSPGKDRYWPYYDGQPLRGRNKWGKPVWRTFRTVDEAAARVLQMSR